MNEWERKVVERGQGGGGGGGDNGGHKIGLRGKHFEYANDVM